MCIFLKKEYENNTQFRKLMLVANKLNLTKR